MRRLCFWILPSCLLLEGCSYLFMHGPPAGHEKLDYFDCDANAAGPVADVSWALLDGVLVAAFASGNSDSDPSGHVGAAPVAIAAALGAAHLASAAYGAVKIGTCSDAREHLRQRIVASAVEKRRIIDELQRRLDAAAVGARSPTPPPSTPNAGNAEGSAGDASPRPTESPSGNSETRSPATSDQGADPSTKKPPN